MFLGLNQHPARVSLPWTASVVRGGDWSGTQSSLGISLPPGVIVLPSPPPETLPAAGITYDHRLGFKGAWLRAGLLAPNDEMIVASAAVTDVLGANWGAMQEDDDLCLTIDVRVPDQLAPGTQIREFFIGLADGSASILQGSPPSFQNLYGWFHFQQSQFSRAGQRLIFPLSKPNVAQWGVNITPQFVVAAVLYTGPTIPSPAAFLGPLFLQRFSVVPIRSSVSLRTLAVPAAGLIPEEWVPLSAFGGPSPAAPWGLAGAHFTREVEIFSPVGGPGIRVGIGGPTTTAGAGAANAYVTIPAGQRLRFPVYRADFVYLQSAGAAIPAGVEWISYT